jgi:PKD repeat protein
VAFDSGASNLVPGDTNDAWDVFLRVADGVHADFSASPTSGPAPLTTVFTNTSTGAYDTSFWTFGDGITSTLQHPVHEYTAPATYSVTLAVSGTGGTDTLTRTNYITVYEPVSADFTGTPTSGLAPLTVDFTNLSTGDYDASLWAFGDGLISTLEHPTHEYALPGTYTVALTVTGPGGTDTLTRPDYVHVYEELAPDFIGSPRSGVPPLAVVFTNTTTGDYTDSLWWFGDGITSTLEHPTHTYQTPASYTVTLQVSGPAGTEILARPDYIQVYQPAVAGFTATPTSGIIPLTVAFTNTSTGDYDTSLWLFGDGTTSDLPNPSHIYPAGGTYTVTLTISGPGGTDTAIKEGYITADFGLYLPVLLRCCFAH